MKGQESLSHTNSLSILSRNYSETRKLVLGAILATFATVFQSAGIIVGFGYVLSILATLPIALSAIMSLRTGFMSYLITILLLAIIQPSELLVFPLTTGLLGISLGFAFYWWKSSILISLFGGVSLTAGISILLYVFQFPILGPSISNGFDIKIILVILVFSIFYSSVWMVLSRKISKHLYRYAVRHRQTE